MSFDDLTPLVAGDIAPDFSLTDQHGRDFSLAAALSAGPVVLAFVPAAFTGICTGEFCELRDNLAMFQDSGAQLVGISADNKGALRAWSDAEGYEFPLLSDFWPHGEVARSFGVFLEDRGVATRGTFLIATDGTIAASFVTPPTSPRPIAAYREALATLA